MCFSILPMFQLTTQKSKTNYYKTYFSHTICSYSIKPYWFIICCSSWIIFIVFETSIKYTCTHIDEFESINYTISHNMNFISFGTFLMLWLSLFYKMIYIYKQKHTRTFIAIFILFNIMSQSLITEILIISDNSPVCIDYFGVVSESAIWGEWLGATPLIIYYTLSITNNEKFNKIDSFFVFSLFLSIFFGFLINTSDNKYSAILFLSLAYVFSIPGVILPFYIYLNYYNDKVLSNRIIEYNNKRIVELIRICFKLSVFIMTYIIVYGIVYLLSLSKILNETFTLVLFQILTIITKNFYYEICLEDTIVIIDQLETNYLEESKEHSAIKTYYKSVIQEIYNPLNVLVLGINLLKQNTYTNYYDKKDIINSIDNAVNELSSTINDVKMVQLIENETLKLNYEKYSIINLINELKTKIENIFDSTLIKFIVNLSDNINNNENDKSIFIDANYVKHVIVSIVDYINKNLIIDDNNILIKISISNDIVKKNNSLLDKVDNINITGNLLLEYLTFSITYNGIKIKKDEIHKIFERFNYNRNFKNDIILDLYLCKKIITLHGGYIWTESNGSNSFSFSIPITQVEPVGYINRYNEIKSIRNSIINSNLIDSNINKIEFKEDNMCSTIINDISDNASLTTYDKNNKFSIIKGWVLIINNVDKIIEKFVTNQKYMCDSIDFFQVKDDNIDYSKYVSIIIYHSSKSYNIIETCKYLRKKGYNNVIIIVTFDLETNYNSYILAGANIVFFHPIKPKELELLFS